ncbi:MAG: hypothetical protein FWC03_08335 [Treponema sp.]|nr:hypothetical protein [Treponema sp.]
MAENFVPGDMDPEIAALMGTGEDGSPPPDFTDMFDNKQTGKPAGGADLSSTGFPPITKRFEEKPHGYFSDPNYYKIALSNEGDISQRIHGILQKYLTTKDPKDRSVFRQQLISPFWEFETNVAKKAAGNLPPPKRFLLRFSLLHPTFISAETRELLGKIVVENELQQPIYYLDEWIKAIGTGAISPSTTDEVKVAAKSSNVSSKLTQLLEKASGKLDGSRAMLIAKDKERIDIEKIIQSRIESIFEHTPLREFNNVSDCLNERQKAAINEIQNLLKDLLKVDHDIEGSIKDYISSETDVTSLKEKIASEGGGGAAVLDVGAIDNEFGTIRQMAKMTCGRQGNHFPILMGEYFHCGPNDVGLRENIIAILTKIESIDGEVYCRVYKNKLNRIVPFVLLLPTYGDTGFCWEPFDRHNRATSRGRIIVPMYPKNLFIAVLYAVADLRWQVAKEKASFYWMEEGLTGNYYQWFQAQKLKGDIKEYFIRDYILWMTKEAEGIQKLDKEVRGTFWRFMPFSRDVKEKLKTRSFVYQELYQRDLNRTMSDGY